MNSVIESRENDSPVSKRLSSNAEKRKSCSYKRKLKEWELAI